MSSYLAYSYSIGLTEEEKRKIDKLGQKNRSKFSKGFQEGMRISIAVYSV